MRYTFLLYMHIYIILYIIYYTVTSETATATTSSTNTQCEVCNQSKYITCMNQLEVNEIVSLL